MRILLAGAGRSGTTWAANVMGRARDTKLVMEPDDYNADILGTLVASRLDPFPALLPSDRSYWYKAVWNLAFAGGWPWKDWDAAHTTGRQMVKIPRLVRDGMVLGLAAGVTITRPRPRNVVVKSNNSMMAIEWVVQRFRPKVVIMRRNPLNVVSSWVAVGHEFPPRPPHQNPLVQRYYMQPLGLTPPPVSASDYGRMAWDIGLFFTALKQAADRHPDWLVISHDEICLAPQKEFARLFESVGLEWTPQADAYLHEADKPGFEDKHDAFRRAREQPNQWRRRLDDAQVDEICDILGGFPLGSWGPVTELV